jgi:hypothetical protein
MLPHLSSPNPILKSGSWAITSAVVDVRARPRVGPFRPAGKLSSTTTCEWFAGGFQLVCRGEERGPTGKRTFLNIRAYDEAAKAYTEYGISSFC